jgi:hypothetical protein
MLAQAFPQGQVFAAAEWPTKAGLRTIATASVFAPNGKTLSGAACTRPHFIAAGRKERAESGGFPRDGFGGVIDDVAVCSFRAWRPVGMARRRRNLKHTIRYDEGRQHPCKHWDSLRRGYQASVLKHAPHRLKSASDLLANWQRLLT